MNYVILPLSAIEKSIYPLETITERSNHYLRSDRSSQLTTATNLM